MESVETQPSTGFECAPNFSPTLQSLQGQYLRIAHLPDVGRRDIRIVGEVVDESTPSALYLAGGMSLDIAARPGLVPDERLDWLAYSRDLWKQVAESSVETGQVDEATLRSAIGLASLPSYLELMYGNRIPDQKVQQTMYTKLCDVALK